MAEPRARVRQKGQVFSTDDLTTLLSTFAHVNQQPQLPNPSSSNQQLPPSTTTTPPLPPQLPTTLSTLDDILTDFIIETCHYAALSASYSRRQKIKPDDFKFVLRGNETLLGRVQETTWTEKNLKEKRKAVDQEEFVKQVEKGEVEEGAGEGGGKGKRRRKAGRGRKDGEGKVG